ncbi:hypothetical protein [Shewanella litorisediminis]|uniref:YcgL domain-containing protein n=1 Tax=Shewanella litorisediminis TaxID=1173586 RepID=A0ABX7G283_9GAMM|nr:hypothetical protein [Shewanella litorisediminis]MCL2918610.1 hypothetical protein [Shewanella litorisediminis]QRH01434.1 hypothetical protein JQC75_16535 [Shewanella litorisediminis]
MSVVNDDRIGLMILGDADAFELSFTPLVEDVTDQPMLAFPCMVDVLPQSLLEPLKTVLDGKMLEGNIMYDSDEPLIAAPRQLKAVMEGMGYTVIPSPEYERLEARESQQSIEPLDDRVY